MSAIIAILATLLTSTGGFNRDRRDMNGKPRTIKAAVKVHSRTDREKLPLPGRTNPSVSPVLSGQYTPAIRPILPKPTVVYGADNSGIRSAHYDNNHKVGSQGRVPTADRTVRHSDLTSRYGVDL